MKTKATKETRLELMNRIKALEAQLTCSLYAAYRELDKVTTQQYMASGVIITITSLSGKSICSPFMCADGLEEITICSLKAEIKKTLAMMRISEPKELQLTFDKEENLR